MINPRLRMCWFAQPNDLIGGWCVMSADHPPSQEQGHEIASCVSEIEARHIVDLHNSWWDEVTSERYI